MKKTIIVWMVAGLSAVVAAQQPDTQYRPGPKPDAAAVAAGQTLFLANCSFCHAADATGASGPDLLRSPLVLRDAHGETIGPVIRGGRPGTAMPSFSDFSDAQIADISAFLRDRIQTAADRMAYTISDAITGNAQAGEAYFNGAGRCATCHSATGDLAGIAGRLTVTRLRSAIAYPAPGRGQAPNPRAQETATVTSASGQTVSGTLVERSEFEITVRDAGGWTHNLALGPGVKVTVHDPLAFHKQQLEQYTDADLQNLVAYLETLK